MHQFELCHHNFFLYTNGLPPVCLLPLNVWSKVEDQPVECPSSHAQNVVEHVGSVDVEEVLFKPTCRSRLHVPSGILNSNVPGNKVRYMFTVWMLQCIFLMLIVLHRSERRSRSINPLSAPQLFPMCEMCSTCFRRCQVLGHHEHTHVGAIEDHVNSCSSIKCGQ